MYCRKCGKRLEEGDAFCTYCGTALPKEEIVRRPSAAAHNPEFSWNVASEYPEPRKRDTMDFDWSSGEMRIRHPESPVQEAPASRPVAPDFRENVPSPGERPTIAFAAPYPEPSSASYEPTRTFEPVSRSYEPLPSNVPRSYEPDPATKEPAFRPYEPAVPKEPVSRSYESSPRSYEPDSFFRGFSSQNAGNPSRSGEDSPRVTGQSISRPYGQAGSYENSSRAYTPSRHLEQDLFREMEEADRSAYSRQEEKFYTFTQKNEEFQKLLDREYEKVRRNAVPPERPLRESVLEMPASPYQEPFPAESFAVPEVPAEPMAEPMAEPIPKAPEAMPFAPVSIPEEAPVQKPFRKSQLDAEEIRTIWEEIKAEMERENANEAALRASEEAKKLEASIESDVNSHTKPSPSDTVRIDNLNPLHANGTGNTDGNAVPLQNESTGPVDHAEASHQETETPPSPAPVTPEEAPGPSVDDKPEGKAVADAVTATALTKIWEQDEEEPERKTGGFWIFLFVLILVIMLAVLADLAVQKFWPDTAIADFAVSAEEWVMNLFEKVKDLFHKS